MTDSMTHMFGLNLEDATDWQRNLLARTHVVDNERCGSMLLFDHQGNPLQDIETENPVFQLPISELKAENRGALRRNLKGFYQSADTHCDTPDLAVDRVLETARQKIGERPRAFRYRSTNEEQYQILRVFNEMQKYPHVAETVFCIERTVPEPAILAAFPDRYGTLHLLDSRNTVGFFSPRLNAIGIANVNPRTFPSTVAEELFHAIDNGHYITRPKFSEQDCDALLHLADNMPDGNDKSALKAIAGFRQDEVYKNIPNAWDKELFAKLATFISLRRYERRHNDQALERTAERQLFDTPACQAVIKVLDTLEEKYKTLPAEEREKAARFAGHVPEALQAQRQRDLTWLMGTGARRPGSIER